MGFVWVLGLRELKNACCSFIARWLNSERKEQAAPEVDRGRRIQEFCGKRRRKNNCREKKGSHGSFTQKPEHNYPLSLLSSLFPPFLPSFSLASTPLPSASYHGNRRGAEKRRETRSVPTRRLVNLNTSSFALRREADWWLGARVPPIRVRVCTKAWRWFRKKNKESVQSGGSHPCRQVDVPRMWKESVLEFKLKNDHNLNLVKAAVFCLWPESS